MCKCGYSEHGEQAGPRTLPRVKCLGCSFWRFCCPVKLQQAAQGKQAEVHDLCEGLRCDRDRDHVRPSQSGASCAYVCMQQYIVDMPGARSQPQQPSCWRICSRICSCLGLRIWLSGLRPLTHVRLLGVCSIAGEASLFFCGHAELSAGVRLDPGHRSRAPNTCLQFLEAMAFIYVLCLSYKILAWSGAGVQGLESWADTARALRLALLQALEQVQSPESLLMWPN